MHRRFIAVGLALLVSAPTSRAAAPQLIGVVESVVDNSLQIKRVHEAPQTIKTDNRTTYTKWVTHQPWQQDTHLNRQAIAVGRCVEVELRSGDNNLAKAIYVNTDGVGTLYDPCKAVR
jgi:hypothetical protein